ncbi:fibrinogen-like protein 1 [Drosophila busckii]|uniref:fibrinogen-like protein 1 n=1 Tax=Drosophila busckii TaxID=30019 RepID=UPI00083F28E3|nr:fibrinogen-like protein 1 [Drosophila busckii]
MQQFHKLQQQELQLQIKILEQQVVIKTQELSFKDLLTNHTLLKNQFQAKFEQQELTINNLQKDQRETVKETIRVPGIEPFIAPCDSTDTGNGWTVIQRRMDGSVNFNQKWEQYKYGFGKLSTEFWLGLEKLHRMTEFQPHELYIQLKDFRNETRYARYSKFSVGNESQSYELSIGGYTGSAGNALELHQNKKFSTEDQFNDNICGHTHQSGWWFTDCYTCNLNGMYTKTGDYNWQSLKWNTWHEKPLKFVQMMIRPSTK